MSGATRRADLLDFLGRAAEACAEAVALHLKEAHPDLRFQRQILFALAAMEGVASQAEVESADIRLVPTTASDAAAVCRTQPPDDAIQAVTARFEEVVIACDGVLGDGPSGKETRRWERFLFADADVSVSREPPLWRVRGAVGEASHKLLDIALEDLLLPLASHRIGELTVLILDWYAHEDRLDRP